MPWRHVATSVMRWLLQRSEATLYYLLPVSLYTVLEITRLALPRELFVLCVDVEKYIYFFINAVARWQAPLNDRSVGALASARHSPRFAFGALSVWPDLTLVTVESVTRLRRLLALLPYGCHRH